MKVKSGTRLNRQEKGITLIALVVTIVVLIILATISINSILGDNGLIKKAQQAKSLYENSVIEEDETMRKLLEKYENVLIKPEEPTGPEMPSTWDKTKVTSIDDGKGNPVPLPKGFYYVGGNIDTGIVISDKSGDTMNASGVNMGNQFVWIPVKDETDLTRTLFDDNGKPSGMDDIYVEPYANATEQAEEADMRKQVLKYGGFYIGRFEAGVNSTILRDDPTEGAQTVVSKKGVAPYNHVPWGNSMDDTDSNIECSPAKGTTSVYSKGIVYSARNMYATSKTVNSTLCYGCQWDAMCRYIGDSGRTTPTKDAPELTGNTATDVSKNIYDLAGNCTELTMESDGSACRIRRGGCIDFDYAISSRELEDPTTYSSYDGFRCALYIK